MTKPTRLVEVANQRRRGNAREIRASFFERGRAAMDQVGTDIAGFAIAVWDTNGDMRTAYDASKGPVGPLLVPTLVSDALNRHVAVKLAEAQLAAGPAS